MRILITGGAGFVGSNLAVAVRTQLPDTITNPLIDFDNRHFGRSRVIGFLLFKLTKNHLKDATVSLTAHRARDMAD